MDDKNIIVPEGEVVVPEGEVVTEGESQEATAPVTPEATEEAAA